MIIKWLFLFGHLRSWTCAFDFSLLRYASVLYAPQSQSARAQFAGSVRIHLRPCLPCSCLHHAVLLVIALSMSRQCAHTVSYIRIPHVIGRPSSPIILVGFLVTSVVSLDMLLIIVVL